MCCCKCFLLIPLEIFVFSNDCSESNDMLALEFDMTLSLSTAFLAEFGALIPFLFGRFFGLFGVELSTISLGGVLNSSYGSMLTLCNRVGAICVFCE